MEIESDAMLDTKGVSDLETFIMDYFALPGRSCEVAKCAYN